jgi:hypothetical protein
MKPLIIGLAPSVTAAVALPARQAVPDISFDGNVDFLKCRSLR